MLARAGLGSRRVCEELIADGRVTVDGEVAVLGRRVDAEHDRIELDGVAVVVDDDLVYYLLNKPPGYVSTASDPQGRPTVVELVPATPRVYPVGRLDADTEGLLLLTNDGELTQLLTHPSHGVVKTYLAEVDGDPAPFAIRQLREGVDARRRPTAPAQAKVVQRRGDTTADRDRHPRRSQPPGAAHVRGDRSPGPTPGAHAYRTLQDRQLEPGAWRLVTRAEVRRLYEVAVYRRRERSRAAERARLTSVGVRLQALRGATTCTEDTKAEIDARPRASSKSSSPAIDLANDDVVSIIFTATPDLTAEFPATSARKALDLDGVPLLGAQEQAVAHGTPRCVRVLIHCYSDRPRQELRHVFLEGAAVLAHRSRRRRGPRACRATAE